VAAGALVVAVLGGTAVVAQRLDGRGAAAVEPATAAREGQPGNAGAAASHPPVFVAAALPPEPEAEPGGPGNQPALAAAAAPGSERPAQAAEETGARWARVAPFSGVRWRGDVPEVEVAGTWAELVSLDGTAADRIVAFCKDRYRRPDSLWRKRFSEDLVEVLSGMGQPPAEKVVLGLESLTDGERRTVVAAMTKENRKRVWERNQAGQPPPQPRSMVDAFARVSPFSGLKFRGDAIDVEVDGAWYRLAAVNGVSVERQVAFAREKFGGRWRKRIAEDPVEVLTGMGVTVGTKVDLALEEPGSNKRIERRDVPLTEDNRRRVKEMWEKP
jgi:hypothetical protein